MATFDEGFYLDLYPDVAAAVRAGAFKSGYDHYRKTGAAEGRWGSSTLDYNERSYLAANPDVAAAVRRGAFALGYDHYLAHGKAEGRLASVYAGFDPYYVAVEYAVSPRRSDGSVRPLTDDDLEVVASRFLQSDAARGRAVYASGFEESAYLARYPDVAAAVFTGALPSGRAHYERWGRAEGRIATGGSIDELAYLQAYPDVALAVRQGGFQSGEEHYFRFGYYENRPVRFVGRLIDASMVTHGVSLFGGLGNDTLIGGADDDLLEGGGGANLLMGGGGDDSLRSGGGNDTLIGGEGDDDLLDSGGTNLLMGGAGNDTLVAGGGNDTLIGGDGDDVLKSWGGAVLVLGGEGNDTLVAGGGNDGQSTILSGGEGRDTFGFTSNWTFDNSVITDFQRGADKIDVTAIGLYHMWDNPPVGITFIGYRPTWLGLSMTEIRAEYQEGPTGPETRLIMNCSYLHGFMSTQPPDAVLTLKGVSNISLSDFILS